MPRKSWLAVGLWLIAFLLFLPKPAFASTTYYFSPTYEKTDEMVTKYYPLAGGAMAMRRGGELSYLHQDHLASTRLVTSEQGTVNSQMDYYPYGQLVNKQLVNSLTDKLYTSQILDSSTDLYFYNARQYNPLTASFISADVAQGLNRYAYVTGNPINKNDPSGNQEKRILFNTTISLVYGTRMNPRYQPTMFLVTSLAQLYGFTGIGLISQHVRVTPEMLASQEWQKIEEEIFQKANLSSEMTIPEKLGAVSSGIKQTLVYNPEVAEGLRGTIGQQLVSAVKYKFTSSLLTSKIATHKTVCFDYAVTGHIVLEKLGIESEVVGSGGHGFLLTYANNKPYIVDPVFGVALPIEDYYKAYRDYISAPSKVEELIHFGRLFYTPSEIKEMMPPVVDPNVALP